MNDTAEAPEVADEVVEGQPAKLPAVLDPLAKIAAGLDELKKEAESVNAVDLSETARDKAQRALRLRCVTLRTTIDEAYETINRPMLETQRAARKLVADIKAAIQLVEAPVDEAIKAREKRKEAERLERERQEAARVAAHRAAIEEVRRAAVVVAGTPSATIAELITATEAWDASAERFEEFADEAEAAKRTTLQALALMYADTLQREQEAARLAAERAALERQREFDARISRIRNLPATVAGRSAAAIATAITSLEGLRFAAWAEYEAPAETARAEALGIMRDAYAAALVREEEAAALARQREQQEAEARRMAAEREALDARQREAAAAESAAQNSQRQESEGASTLAEQHPVAPSGSAQAEGGAVADAAASPGSCDEAAPGGESSPPAGGGYIAPHVGVTVELNGRPAAEVATEFVQKVAEAEAENPSIKLGDILASIDANGGVKFTRQYIEEVHGIHGKRDGAAWLYTKAQRRALLLSIAHTLTEVA